MARSQNSTFRGEEPESVGERIRGASIARHISTGLSNRGWLIHEIDDCWRDAGFLIPVQRDLAYLDVVLVQYHGEECRWILQIAATHYPGVLRRIFGCSPSASSDDVYRLASDVHAILTERRFSDTHWCWDDFAEGDHCTHEPSPPGKIKTSVVQTHSIG